MSNFSKDSRSDNFLFQLFMGPVPDVLSDFVFDAVLPARLRDSVCYRQRDSDGYFGDNVDPVLSDRHRHDVE